METHVMKLYFITVFVASILSFLTIWIIFGIFSVELSYYLALFTGMGIAVFWLFVSTIIVASIDYAIDYIKSRNEVNDELNRQIEKLEITIELMNKWTKTKEKEKP